MYTISKLLIPVLDHTCYRTNMCVPSFILLKKAIKLVNIDTALEQISYSPYLLFFFALDVF